MQDDQNKKPGQSQGGDDTSVEFEPSPALETAVSEGNEGQMSDQAQVSQDMQSRMDQGEDMEEDEMDETESEDGDSNDKNLPVVDDAGEGEEDMDPPLPKNLDPQAQQEGGMAA